jgi:spore coat protein H
MATRSLPIVAAALLSCANPPAAPDAELQAAFFDPEVVQDIELEISRADLARLDAALPERIFVPATFRWRGITLAGVGVRYKGNSSSFPAGVDLKRGLLIKFGEFAEGQRFIGLRRVALDNGIQFGSLFSERLITDILRAEGVITFRTNYARLFVNGEYLGVYVNEERLDKSFLERAYADPEGSLYDCDEGGPGANLLFLGDDPALYRQAFEAQTNEETADLTDLVALIRLINTAPDADFAAAIEAAFEVEPFLRTMAVMVLAGAFDQYTGFQPHNYELYRDPADGRFHYLPYDLDVGFADDAFGSIPVIDGWSAAAPLAITPLPLIERILADPGLSARYRAAAAEILEAHFRPEILEARLDALFAQVEADLAADPFPARRVTNPEDAGGYEGIIASMKAFIERRHERALVELGLP